jgi:lysophospholipase L1-like esterase
VVTGIKWDGVDMNAVFVSGGFFSLDGYHPNQKGYALIANEFIKAINNKYNAVIPTINCIECNGVLFP